MQLINTSLIEEKKSKFLGFAYQINDLNEIKIIIKELKEKHSKAKHIVYAYKLKESAGKTDDKEPNGTAGSQIYNLIELKKLDNILIVVVRYYGGTKLGAGLLSRTYKNAAIAALEN